MAEPWILHTVALADSLLGPRELDAIRQHLGEDYRAEALAGAVATIRSYCAARGELGAEGTIPPECLRALRGLYRYSLLSNMPTGNLMTPARLREYEDALTYLKDVGLGRAAITRPAPAATGPEDLARTGPVSPAICAPERLRDRRGLDGGG